MSKFRVGIVGAGGIARGPHIQGWQAIPEAEVVAVADVNRDAATSFAKEHNVPQVFADFRQLVQLDLDAVDVCTPNNVHTPAVLAALNAGKHVLCEKPLAVTTREVRQMGELADQKKLKLMTAQHLRYNAASQAIKNWVEAGNLGRLYHGRWVARLCRARGGIDWAPGSMAWSFKKELNGGGTLMDWSPYDLAVLHDLLQPVSCEIAAAVIAQPETANTPAGCDVEFHGCATLLYRRANGDRVNIHFERAAAHHGEHLTVHELEGTRGAVKLDWVSEGGLKFGFDCEGKSAGEEFRPDKSPLNPHHRPLREMLRLLRGEPNASVVDAAAIFNIHVLRAIYDVAATGRPVTVTKENW